MPWNTSGIPHRSSRVWGAFQREVVESFQAAPSDVLHKHLIGHWSGEKVLIILDNSFADVNNGISVFLAWTSQLICENRESCLSLWIKKTCISCQYNEQKVFIPLFCPWRGYIVLVPYILRLGKAWKQNHEELYFCLVLSKIIGSLTGDKCKLLCYLFS